MRPRPSTARAPVSAGRRAVLRRLVVGAVSLAGLGTKGSRGSEDRSAHGDGEVTSATGRLALPESALRTIPSSGVRVPSVGMGTWLTFDLEPGRPGTDARVAVMRAFLDAGGGVLDSSPMYGHAEAMIGHTLARMAEADSIRAAGERAAADTAEGATSNDRPLFAASKIWTPIPAMASGQMANTESLWNVGRLELMQVHNLVGLGAHLPRLRDWKAAGRIAHVGVTTSHGRRHAELEALMRREPLDTVQLTLNATHRETEKRLLPLAADRGMAVIVNRPLDGGRLPRALARRPLSPLAVELGCGSWAEYCLLFVVSHPAVTCAIPATTRVEHLRENAAVARLPLPDARTREAMAREIA